MTYFIMTILFVSGIFLSILGAFDLVSIGVYIMYVGVGLISLGVIIMAYEVSEAIKEIKKYE